MVADKHMFTPKTNTPRLEVAQQRSTSISLSTENAPTCNGSLRRHGCSAMYDGDYHECVVPNTGDIVSISVFNKVSKDADCLFYPPPTINTVWTSGDGGAYSFEENRIIIAGGCRGVFDVCTSGKKLKGNGCLNKYD